MTLRCRIRPGRGPAHLEAVLIKTQTVASPSALLDGYYPATDNERGEEQFAELPVLSIMHASAGFVPMAMARSVSVQVMAVSLQSQQS